MIRPTILAIAMTTAAPAAAQSPIEIRNIAMKVLEAKAGIERVASNCRWIRGTDIRPRAKAWLDDNGDFVEAAHRVIDNQGGLTRDRAALAEQLGAHAMQNQSMTRESCNDFGKKLASGDHDLIKLLPTKSLLSLTRTKEEVPSETVWVVETRRLPNGTLGHVARPYGLDDGIEACDRHAAAKGHIWTRARYHPDGSPVVDPDPELWMSECLANGTDPTQEGRS